MTQIRTTHWWTVAAIVAVLGLLLNALAWKSPVPVAVTLVFYCLGFAFTGMAGRQAPYAKMVYTAVFAAYWVAGGVSALYYNYATDVSQLYGDASRFYLFASSGARDLTLPEISELSEGAVAIQAWSVFYELGRLLGIEPEIYIGTSFNILVSSLSVLVAYWTLRLVETEARATTTTLLLLCFLCPLIWLGASIHIRDCFVMLLVGINYYASVRFLQHPRRFSAIALLALVSVLIAWTLFYLRTELYLVPLALAAVALISLFLFGSRSPQSPLRFLVVLLPVGALLLFGNLFDSMGGALVSDGHETYLRKTLETHSSDSLGYALVAQQTGIVRVVTGIAYLFLMPVPLWAGFSAGSSYAAFKSAFGLFNYIFVPVLAVSIWKFREVAPNIKPTQFFLYASAGMFFAAVALSSLENRHILPFLPPLFIAVTLASPVLRRHKQTLMAAIIANVALMMLTHAAWAILKY